jgi:chloramphenicol-sensitive protein RarD
VVAVLAIVLSVRQQWKWLPSTAPAARAGQLYRQRAAADGQLVRLHLVVNNGHVIDASLGYFINPLINVLLGQLVLKERCAARSGWPSPWRLRRGLADLAGQLPWIALILGITSAPTACCARPPRWRHWKACRWKPCCCSRPR